MELYQNCPVVIISAYAEWRIIRELYESAEVQNSPYGEWFAVNHEAGPLVFFFEGWGKIAAAGSTQYAIDHLKPSLLINIGTCGGFDPSLKAGDVILANKTLLYDIIEQMGDAQEAINDYTTEIDISWLPEQLPQGTYVGLLLSADRDIIQADVAGLRDRYQAKAADWESGAIAWIADKNKVPVLILRGVSDVVYEGEALAYGDLAHFEAGTRTVMTTLNEQLPIYMAAHRIKAHLESQ